ncbi:MAG: hypothetical protein SF123_23855, partial [Chloroflexota bacterium]|nr:hypothetical protein [Chloroflexota bacterium]
AVTGRSLRASIDGAMVLHYVDRAPLPPGQVWMAVDGIPTGEVWIDNVQMTGSTPRADIAPPPIDMSAANVNLSPFSTQEVVVFDRLMSATTGDHNMFRMNIDGSGLVELPNTSGSKDYDPVLSPNHTEIAFSSWRNGNIDIWVMKTDGTNLRALTNSTAHDYSPVWSPDGTKIAFVSDRGGIAQVYTMNSITGEAGGGIVTPITSGKDPAWSPDGTALVVSSQNMATDLTWDLYLVDMTTTAYTRYHLLGEALRAEVQPSWSSDSSAVIFTSIIYNASVTGYHTLYLVAETTSNININWFQIEVGQATPTPPPVCLVQFPSGTTPDRFNVYDQPTTEGNSENIATVIAGQNIPPAGIEVIGIYPNPQGELWYRLGAYRTSLTGGWTRVGAGIPALPDISDCENVALVNRNGEQTAAPSPTTNYTDICLFILDTAVASYDLSGIRERTNGGNASTVEIAANVPIVIRRVHLNLQYALVSYNDATGAIQTPRWIKYSEANIAQFTPCVTASPTPQAPRIGEGALPICQANQYLNCRPATAPVSPRIFNGVAATVIAPFGDPVLGCDNAEPGCWVNRQLEVGPPCPLYVNENGEVDTENANNCGVDIVTQPDFDSNGLGPKQVFLYSGGRIIGYFLDSGTLQLATTLNISSNGGVTIIARHNYTHIALISPLLETTGEYIASGVEIGAYGPIGPFGTRQHVDTVQVNNESSYSSPPWE